MDARRIIGFAMTLAVVAVVALAVTLGLGWLFSVLPVPWPTAAPVGEAVGVAIAIAVADSLAPWGHTIAADLQAKPRTELAVDLLVDAALAFVAGVGVAFVTTNWVAVIGVGVLLGYGSFIYRNQGAYGGDE